VALRCTRRQRIRVQVTLPANAKARIALPAAGPQDIQADGASFSGMEDGQAVYAAGSGAWQFLVKEAPAASRSRP
jgi:alpha-L-rhamnosidase